eukprot:jgi/Botrbrau1/5692/Bobra.0071s0026.1
MMKGKNPITQTTMPVPATPAVPVTQVSGVPATPATIPVTEVSGTPSTPAAPLIPVTPVTPATSKLNPKENILEELLPNPAAKAPKKTVALSLPDLLSAKLNKEVVAAPATFPLVPTETVAAVPTVTLPAALVTPQNPTQVSGVPVAVSGAPITPATPSAPIPCRRSR